MVLKLGLLPAMIIKAAQHFFFLLIATMALSCSSESTNNNAQYKFFVDVDVIDIEDLSVRMDITLIHNFPYAICIPRPEYFPSGEYLTSDYLELESTHGDRPEYTGVHVAVDVPEQNFVVISPGHLFVFVADIAKSYGLRQDESYSLEFSIPAAPCSIFNKYAWAFKEKDMHPIVDGELQPVDNQHRIILQSPRIEFTIPAKKN